MDSWSSRVEFTGVDRRKDIPERGNSMCEDLVEKAWHIHGPKQGNQL